MTAIRSAACLCLLAVCFFIYLPISQARTNPELIDNGDHCKKLLAQLWPLKSLMQRKNFLENAAHECPDNAMLQYYYGVNLERRLQYEKALRYYRLSLKLNSLFPPAYFRMGETYFSLGDKSAAVQAYKKGLQIQPDNKWGAGRLREILAMQNRPGSLNAGSSRRGKTFDQQRSPDTYEKSIAERYGIDLDTLIQTKNRIASIKKIAGRYGISLDELLQAGEKTFEPGKKADSAAAGQQDAQKKYLAAIARRYGIRTDELSRVSNQLSSVKEIAARYGIRLNDLMGGKKTALSFEKKKSPLVTHKVRKNEYLSRIANRYGVSLDEILKANKEIDDPHWIFPGQVLVIPDKKR